MADQPEPSVIEELRRELAEKSRQLSELDVILADYQDERARLIAEVRLLQARLSDLLEQITDKGMLGSESQDHKPT